MSPSPKGFFASLRSVSRRIYLRATGRRSGQWVEGSYTEPHRSVFFLPNPNSKRYYGLHLPGGYASRKAWPLLVMLHGCKQDALTFAAGTRMNQLADREGFLVLYPEQRRTANAYRCWNWFDSSQNGGGNEAEIIAGMVRDVITTYAVDPGRVYIAGISAGGAMTSVMAHCHGDLFAACAIHSGLMYRAAESVSEAARAMRRGSSASPQYTARQAVSQENYSQVPALVIHGTKDETVHPKNADQAVEQFVAMSRHTREGEVNVTETNSDESKGNGYAYKTSEYRLGDKLLARKVLVEGLGHAWSGGDAEHAFNDAKSPNASRMIWEFFSAFERRER